MTKKPKAPEIYARVIQHTVYDGIEIMTMETCYPKSYDAQLQKHRTMAQSGRSSRAVPTDKVLKEIREAPAMPLVWTKNQRGMYGSEILSADEGKVASGAWKSASRDMAGWAFSLSDMGVHKQYVNRLLEPFGYTYSVKTATNKYLVPDGEEQVEINPWDFFFGLRIKDDVQPDVRLLAEKMKAAYEASTPTRRDIHLPYVTLEEEAQGTLSECMLVSAMRCARVSYAPFVGKTDFAVDRDKAKWLWEQRHLTPFEHPAMFNPKGQFMCMFNWQGARSAFSRLEREGIHKWPLREEASAE